MRHVVHQGGVRGVLSEEDVKAGKVMIVAPVGFLQAAVVENVWWGNVMSRRASYMYGTCLRAARKDRSGPARPARGQAPVASKW
jgi:alkyl sulfatase BDS1-like metallo-beta-lactamase superfamily hydrolase